MEVGRRLHQRPATAMVIPTRALPVVMAAAVVAMLVSMLGLATPAAAQEGTVTCYAIADGDVGNNGMNNETVPDTLVRIDDALGAATATVVGAIGDITSTDAEAMAIRRGAATPIYAWETGTGLFTIDPVTGVTQGAAPFQVGADKVEGLTWANTDDTDLANDILYVIRTNGDVIGFDSSGNIVVAAVNATAGVLDEGADVAWDPATDTVYAVITNNADVSEVVVVSGGGPVGGPTDLDMEGLGFDLDGQMYGTTGNDGADALHTINKANGTAALLIDLEASTTVFDHEDVDCIDLAFPSEPGVISGVLLNECVADDGKVTATVTYDSGDLAVDYQVTVTGQAPIIGTIASGDAPEMVMVADLPDGSTTITITNTTDDSVVATETVDISCDPNPGVISAVLAVACVDDDGKVTVTVSYDSGEVPVDFTMAITGQQGQLGTIDAQSTPVMVMQAGLADGNFTVTLTDDTNAILVLSQEFPVACDPMDPGVIMGNVWSDTDADGQEGAAPVGLVGVDVTLWTSDGAGNPLAQVVTVQTGADGKYTFDPVEIGDYVIQVALPADSTFTTQNNGDDATDSDVNNAGISGLVSVGPAQMVINVDAGVVPPPPGSITGIVWSDTDADGQEGAAPVGLVGVDVTLWAADGAGNPQASVVTVQTGADGRYTFDPVEMGNYVILVALPADSTFTTQNSGPDATDSDVNNAGFSSLVLVGPAQMVIDIDAGIVPPGAVTTELTQSCVASNGVFRFIVTNTTDTAVQATLKVTGLPDKTVTVPANTTTTVARSGRADGSYQVEGLIDGVSVVSRTEVVDCDPDEVTLALLETCASNNGLIRLRVQNATDAPAQVTLKVTGLPDKTITVAANSSGVVSRSGRADGVYAVQGLVNGAVVVDESVTVSCDAPAQGPGTIGNRVWLDTDGDGLQEVNQNGAIGVVVNLWSVDGAGNPAAIIDTTTTAAAGLYSFTNVAAGNYRVQVVAPDGYDFTLQNSGGPDTTDSDVDGGGISDLIVLAAGQTNNTVDAGLVVSGSANIATIGNRVWFDTDADGIQEANQNGAIGVTVNLWSVDGAGNPAAIIDTTTTAAAGLYSFSTVPGDYRVQVVAPAGYGFAPQNVGADNLDSDVAAAGASAGVSDLITVTGGQTNNTIDAGLVADGAGTFTANVEGQCAPGGRIKLTFTNGSSESVDWSYDVVEVTMHPLVTGTSAPGEMTMKFVTGRRDGTYTVNLTVNGVASTETVVIDCM